MWFFVTIMQLPAIIVKAIMNNDGKYGAKYPMIAKFMDILLILQYLGLDYARYFPGAWEFHGIILVSTNPDNSLEICAQAASFIKGALVVEELVRMKIGREKQIRLIRVSQILPELRCNGRKQSGPSRKIYPVGWTFYCL